MEQENMQASGVAEHHPRLTAAEQKLAEMHGSAKDFVCKNPEKSALIAAGVGAALGIGLTALLMRRK